LAAARDQYRQKSGLWRSLRQLKRDDANVAAIEHCQAKYLLIDRLRPLKQKSIKLATPNVLCHTTNILQMREWDVIHTYRGKINGGGGEFTQRLTGND
jgi:hypothetical protein